MATTRPQTAVGYVVGDAHIKASFNEWDVFLIKVLAYELLHFMKEDIITHILEKNLVSAMKILPVARI